MTKSDAGQLGGIATLQIHGVERCQCFGKRGGRPRRQAAGAAVDNNGEGALTSRPPREV